MKKIIKYLLHPNQLLVKLVERRMIFLPDRLFLKLQFKCYMGYKLNLSSPKTFNEKLQWLKLYDRKSEYTNLVDKYEAKKIIGNILGEQYIIPTYGIYNKFDEINFDKLPRSFVIKTTHYGGSNGVFIVKDKNTMNIDKIKKGINSVLKKNLYYYSREWPYKNVKPRIIIEEYLTELSSEHMKDYKFYCFNGQPRYLYISEGLDDHSTGKIDFFEMDLSRAPFGRTDFMHFDVNPQKPKNFEKMISISKKLSKKIPFVRVDLYNVDGKIYFSELTFYPSAGLMNFNPPEWDEKLGDLIKLPEKRREK